MTFDLDTTPGHRLCDEPFAWVHQKMGDQSLIVYADSRRHEDGSIINEIMLEGSPVVLMPVVTGPEVLLDESYTEFAGEYPANRFDWRGAAGTELTAVPDVWHVGIAGGHELIVHANDVQERDGEHVFTLTVRGGGPGLPVLQVSDSLVTSIRQT